MAGANLDESRYRTAFQRAPIGFLITDIHGMVLDANPAAQKILGYGLEELRTRHFSQLTHPDDVAASREAAERVRQGKDVHVWLEKRYLRKDGQSAWCRVELAAVREPAGAVRHVIAMIQDITERKATEDALRESQRAMATLLSNIPGLVYRCRNDRDWTMEFVSEGCLELTGYRPDELVGNRVTSFGRLIHLVDQGDVYDRVQEALAAKRPYQLTYRIVARDGQIKWVWEQGRGVFSPAGELLALEGLITDMTDRKRAEEALVSSEAMLSSIIDQSPISTWILDAGGTLIRQNAACRKLLGIERDEQTVGVYNIFHDRLAIEGGYTEAIRKVFTEGRMMRETIDYNISEAGCVDVPGGRRLRVAVSLFPVKDRTGKVLYVVGQHEDVTQLRDREEQLRQAQKMEAIGRLVGSIAHDFNNQLTIVQGYAELLLHDLGPDDPARESVDQILKAARRSAGLTSQLLAYSRKQALHPQVLDLNQTLHEMADPIRKIIGENVKLSIRPAKALGRVRVDPVHVQQAIMNIVVNARDAMSNGGRLTIATANVDSPAERPSRAPDALVGPCVLLTITDTGIGMDEQTRLHIFDPFFTTKPLGQGTGLGLSTVYGFVQQSGGRVEVVSTPGHGSAFRIYLPRVPEPSGPAAASQ
jgi:PAS domain S-box-containing protein